MLELSEYNKEGLLSLAETKKNDLDKKQNQRNWRRQVIDFLESKGYRRDVIYCVIESLESQYF